ncbi:HAD-IIA family hydrolase [Ensifer soli]|uniref:HAD-IIA family hydrolase n=1 Tax=Ciceribacter sp. sgz301302 TaxID=3342379 RepID=UPI0035B764BA
MTPPIRAIVSDLDGVVYRGETAIPGAVETIADWARRGIPYVFVTNNSAKSAKAFADKLRRLGVALSDAQVLTSTDATAAYVGRHFRAGIATYVIGEAALVDAVTAAGASLVDHERADLVVLGSDYDFNFRKMFVATRALRAGAALVVTNPDVIAPLEDGVEPCVGAFLAALLAAAPDVVPAIVGKPSPLMILEALERLGTRPEETIMVGDQIATDIIAGQSAGLRSYLVSTGIPNPHASVRPDAEIASLAEIPVG